MKTSSRWLVSATAISALTLATFAQNSATTDNAQRSRVNRTDVAASRDAIAPEHLGRVVKASELIGKNVRGVGDEKVGEIHDLGVDLKAGRVVHVLVSAGGILGTRGNTLAVPPRAFSTTGDDDTLRLNIDHERIRNAPVFDTTRWNNDPNAIAEVYNYYRQDPYFMGTNRVDGIPDGGKDRVREGLGHVDKASKLIGANVRGNQDETIGEIEDMVVDLSNGRIVHVVVSSGGFLGIGDELSVIPPTAFDYDANRQRVHLNATKETLTSAPRFKKDKWPNFGDPEYSTGVYRAYGKDPYFAKDADNTAQNKRDRNDAALTPLDQGSSEGDVELTRNIRKEIVGHDDLSVNAKNIKVITLNGKVTLRGPVNSEQEKRLLADIVARVAPNGVVDNQLEVRQRRD